MMGRVYDFPVNTFVSGQFTFTLPTLYPHPVPSEGNVYWPFERNSTADTEHVVYLSDPDAGLSLRPGFVARLRRQAKRVAAGDRGTPLEEVLRELSLT